MFKKTLILSAIALTAQTVLFGGEHMSANAQGWNQNKVFCVYRGWEARVFVSFKGNWEHGVKIIPYGTNYTKQTTFNNYIGRGAGPEWQYGARGVVLFNPTNQAQQCYYIETKHKPSGANGNVQWQFSNDLVRRDTRFYKVIVSAKDRNNGSSQVLVKLGYRR